MSPLGKIETSPLAGERTKMSKKSVFFSALDAYENPGAGERSEVC
jgi:hypothetical protein